MAFSSASEVEADGSEVEADGSEVIDDESEVNAGAADGDADVAEGETVALDASAVRPVRLPPDRSVLPSRRMRSPPGKEPPP
jgi:hypothetical protein